MHKNLLPFSSSSSTSLALLPPPAVEGDKSKRRHLTERELRDTVEKQLLRPREETVAALLAQLQ